MPISQGRLSKGNNQTTLFAEQYINNSSSIIIGINCAEVVVIYNTSAEEFMGLPASEVIGRPFTELLDKTSDSDDSILLQSLRTGKTYSHVEATVRSAVGVANVMAYTTVIEDDAKNTVGAILTIRDITPQKQLEEKVVNDQKLIMIGELAAEIADEIRNPLTSVKGFLQLLTKRFTHDANLQLYINLMLGEIRKANNMITGLLLSSRPSVPITKQVSIYECLEEVLKVLDDDIHSKAISVKKSSDQVCPLVEVDPEQIKQVIRNVILNSIEAVSNKGYIEIETKCFVDKGLVQLKFSDNGPGISRSDYDRIFEPFYSTKKDRTGLGLTIAQKIIENHGGSINVKSSQGYGAVFTVLIPVLQERQR